MSVMRALPSWRSGLGEIAFLAVDFTGGGDGSGGRDLDLLDGRSGAAAQADDDVVSVFCFLSATTEMSGLLTFNIEKDLPMGPGCEGALKATRGWLFKLAASLNAGFLPAASAWPCRA